MRKSSKKLAAILMAMTMVAGALTGCSGGKTDSTEGKSDAVETNQQQSEATSTPVAQQAEEVSPYTDYSQGFEKKVTIQIPVFDRAFEGWDVTNNYYTRWVQSEFGDKYNVNVEFVAIGRSTQVNDYMQMLASGKAPDIIFHYDMPQMLAYYAEESMQALDHNEIAYYAPTYWTNMGETIQTYGAVNNDPYFVFAARPDAYNSVTLIRQDWIDAVGKQMPTSLEELNEVLVAWKEAGLGNGGGNLIMNSYTYDYTFRNWPVDEKERALYSDLAVAAFNWEPTHNYLKNLNYQYNNGLIDTEFYLNTDDASTMADFVAGNSGIYSLNLSSSSTVIDSLLQNDANAKVAYLPLAAKTPAGNMPQSRAYWPFGMIMGINYSTSAEERAAVWMYLEWLSQPENLFYMQYGVEGENYTLADNGLVIKNTEFTGESVLSQNNNKDYWCLVTESAVYEDEELNRQANLANWAPVGYEYLIEDAYEDFMACKEYSTPDALFTVVIDSLAEYKGELTNKWQELYVKCAMAPEDQFEATYQAACQEYLNAGYQAILDEKQAAIDAGNYN